MKAVLRETACFRRLVTFAVVASVGLFFDEVPVAEGADDCASIRLALKKAGKKVRKAKRIDNRARKQKTLRRLKKKQRKLRRQLAACLAMPAAAGASAIFPIEMVRVGNPGNVDDPADGDSTTPGDQHFGAVAYLYQIGKYEVTVEQYAAFLNAVAKTDTYDLYDTNMATAYGGLIARNGADGSYTYVVIGSGKRPIISMNWFDAARFCNWLHNQRPVGMQDLTTTEDGAYTLNGATTGVGFSRNPGAKYWIPSEDEWYKAAYHDPRGELQGGPAGDTLYWLWPTQSDTLDGPPTPEAPPGGAHSANFGNSVNSLTDVGAYRSSPSYYGTFDQGGNIREWNDAVIGSSRGLRGGSWNIDETGLRSSNRGSFNPDSGSLFFGFRIASP